MTFLQKNILNQSTESILSFASVLRRFWGEYHIYAWNNNKKFTSFQGRELSQFLENIDLIIKFMQSEFETMEYLEKIFSMLRIWSSIPKCLGITHIEDHDSYLDKLELFEKMSKTFIKLVQQHFCQKLLLEITKRFICTPCGSTCIQLQKKTFKQHTLGLGIFSMQGFERRNKESKNVFRHFNNRKENVVIPNLKRLWDLYLTTSMQVNIFV